MRLTLLLAVLAAFSAFSGAVILQEGYFGFLLLALREGWAMQMLLDLCIALVLFALWLVPDARANGISPWPYVVALVATGSIGALLYLVHRELARRRVKGGALGSAAAAR